ncbi:MAG: UvrD-helicase domain-containing protein, partial [Tepidiformaceae bacterium]
MIELTSGGVFDEFDADAKAREDILTQIRETLFVEAGAGTGKTTSLVGRIVSLVANGVSLSNVAAITFTEKAAAELKDRVREELEKAVSTEATPAEIRALHQAALDELDGAAIQTLHSFAQRILSQYPIEAGLPPRIEMRDDIAAHLAFDAQWNSFLDRLLEGETSDLPLERAVLLALEIAKLKDVALSFHDHWDRLRMQGPLFEGGDPKAEVDVRALLDALEETTDALEMCAKADCDDKLEAHIRNIFVPYEARLRAAQSDQERMIILADGTWLAGVKGWGIGGHWVGPTKSEVHASRDAATEERDRLLSELRTACIGPILEEVRRFVLRYAAERRANGELEFHDLLVLARDLLRDNAEARKRLGERYQKLLIDEFQDTDPVQIEIAALLASHFDGAAPAWDAIAVESGRLFFVGDPKQSIYRFRSADIELYERAHERFGQETRRLTQNFRSGPGIIAWVNEVFGQLFEEHRGVGQVEYVPLTPRLGAEDRSLQTVRLLGGPQGGDGQKATAGRVRRREAPEIAQAIRAIRADKWAVGDGTQDGSREAQYADITILLPARTALPPLERALEDADIPFRVESQSLLYATQEVRDLISILAAIDD